MELCRKWSMQSVQSKNVSVKSKWFLLAYYSRGQSTVALSWFYIKIVKFSIVQHILFW